MPPTDDDDVVNRRSVISEGQRDEKLETQLVESEALHEGIEESTSQQTRKAQTQKAVTN